MKKILIHTMWILVAVGITGATYAKSRSKSSSSKSSSSSSKSSTSSSKPSNDTSSSAKADAGKKQTAGVDKNNRMHKNKTHHCRLPDGSINKDASQDLCQKVGGKWVRY